MVKSPPLKDVDEDTDLFYFESDILALKGNPDYSEMLKVFVTLQAQRNIAIENCSAVSELKKQCLEDPLGCVDKLRTGKLEVPPMLRIAELPYINWSKYNVKIPETYIRQLNVTKCRSTQQKVEHRKAKLSWTVEEQRKLEELLVKYPPETVEANRIKKIANEMGTRTERQVASRLQKYYLKLVNSGMPISGQLPRTKIHQKLKRTMRMKFLKPTTFLPNLQVPVNMSELDDVPGSNSTPLASEEHSLNTENYLLSTYSSTDGGGGDVDAEKSDIRLQLELVARIKEELVCESAEYKLYSHFGFTCDYCREDPIRGSRWHCAKCTSVSVDFCTNCMLSQLYSSRPHPLNHKFLVVRNDHLILDPSDSESDTDSDKNDDSNFDSSDVESAVVVKEEPGFSEHCPVDIFEPKPRLNGDTQDDAYGYLHSNLFAAGDDKQKY